MKQTYRVWIKWAATAFAVSAVIFVSGCGESVKETPTVEQEAVENDQLPVPSSDGSVEKPMPYTAPLTGLGSEQELKDRPVMVMIENSPQARPQTGLDQADIVYEILAEGEITRFAALFHSHSPDKIGPVRSIRPYYAEIGEGWDALIVHAGWSQDAINMIKSRNLAHFDEVYGDGEYYWRDSSRKKPHNLYTSVEKIREGAERKNYRSEWKQPALLFRKPDDAPMSGKPAARVTIPYLMGYEVEYEYDPASGLYKRYMAGEPHVDPSSDKQLTAANVLICEARHRILDEEGRRNVDINGPGKGYILQNGSMKEMTWKRSDGIIRAYIDNEEVPLVPGQTWIQIVPEGSAITAEPESQSIEAGGQEQVMKPEGAVP